MYRFNFIDVDFVIVGQVEEFEMLETPKIYYPYNFLKKISKEIKLENLYGDSFQFR